MQAVRRAATSVWRGVPIARTCARLPVARGHTRPVQLWAAICGPLQSCPPARSAARSLSTSAQAQAEVINPKPDASRDAPLRSPGALGGGGGSCGSAAPTMSDKLEQKAMDELDDMSIIDEVLSSSRAVRARCSRTLFA